MSTCGAGTCYTDDAARFAANPLDPALHRRCLGLMRTHMMIGGLPAVVERYRAGRDLRACQKLLEDILLILQDDFAKYKKRVPATPYREALGLLAQAHLVRMAPHTSGRGVPLGGEIDERKFKAFVFDAGMHLRMQGLDIADLLVKDDLRLVTEGTLAEVYAGVELTAGMVPHQRPELYYWHREAPASNAEVDYIIARGPTVIPVEVKSGTRGAMQSMRRFLDERQSSRGLRLSQENFTELERIQTVPLYAAGWIPRYEWIT